jgi:hypothetical protein
VQGVEVPQLFQGVELAYPRHHDVHDDVRQVDQNPFAVALALDALRPIACLLGLFEDILRDGADVPVGCATRDDHEIGHIGETTHVQHFNLHSFQIGESVGDDGFFGATRLSDCGGRFGMRFHISNNQALFA